MKPIEEKFRTFTQINENHFKKFSDRIKYAWSNKKRWKLKEYILISGLEGCRLKWNSKGVISVSGFKIIKVNI